jgi:hypothetical protein
LPHFTLSDSDRTPLSITTQNKFSFDEGKSYPKQTSDSTPMDLQFVCPFAHCRVFPSKSILTAKPRRYHLYFNVTDSGARAIAASAICDAARIDMNRHLTDIPDLII